MKKAKFIKGFIQAWSAGIVGGNLLSIQMGIPPTWGSVVSSTIMGCIMGYVSTRRK